MSQCFEKQTRGKVLYVDNNSIYKSIQNKLYLSQDFGKSWKLLLTTPAENWKDRLAYRFHIAARLLRKGIHHINFFEDGAIGMIYDKKIGLFHNNNWEKGKSIIGSRPLSFEQINNNLIFGEYRSNPERSEINVFTFDKDQIYSKLKMSGIRHIHGIYLDPYTDKVWITTGDENHEAFIYRTDKEFNKLDIILSGSQQTRTIKLLFDEHYVYFGSDAPHEINHIYKLKKDTKQVSKLVQVGSSVFHGTKVKNWMFFSTAIEPSKVNKTKEVEIWASPNGDDWKCILKFKKDVFSMRYFQYGQVFFPIGASNNELWLSLFATQNSNKSFAIGLNQIQKLFDKI